MRKGQRNFGRGALLALLALGASSLTPAHTADAATPRLNVHSGAAGGFSLSGNTHRHAGRVTIDFTNSNKNGSDVVLLKLLHGTKMSKVISDIAAQNGPAAAAATRALTREAHIFGGAGLQVSGQSAQVTETLYSGTYYLLDVNAIFAKQRPTVRTIHVYGRPAVSAFPRIGATIAMTSSDRFVSPATLPAGANLLIRNVSDTLHFVTFQPVRRGTTDAYMTSFFAGKTQAAPYTGPGVQADVLSPRTQFVFHSSALKKGTYDMECYIADDMTGMPHALMGMHKIVTVG